MKAGPASGRWQRPVPPPGKQPGRRGDRTPGQQRAQDDAATAATILAQAFPGPASEAAGHHRVPRGMTMAIQRRAGSADLFAASKAFTANDSEHQAKAVVEVPERRAVAARTLGRPFRDFEEHQVASARWLFLPAGDGGGDEGQRQDQVMDVFGRVADAGVEATCGRSLPRGATGPGGRSQERQRDSGDVRTLRTILTSISLPVLLEDLQQLFVDLLAEDLARPARPCPCPAASFHFVRLSAGARG